jgi:hypothetical protein
MEPQMPAGCPPRQAARHSKQPAPCGAHWRAARKDQLAAHVLICLPLAVRSSTGVPPRIKGQPACRVRSGSSEYRWCVTRDDVQASLLTYSVVGGAIERAWMHLRLGRVVFPVMHCDTTPPPPIPEENHNTQNLPTLIDSTCIAGTGSQPYQVGTILPKGT